MQPAPAAAAAEKQRMQGDKQSERAQTRARSRACRLWQEKRSISASASIELPTSPTHPDANPQDTPHTTALKPPTALLQPSAAWLATNTIHPNRAQARAETAALQIAAVGGGLCSARQAHPTLATRVSISLCSSNAEQLHAVQTSLQQQLLEPWLSRCWEPVSLGSQSD